MLFSSQYTVVIMPFQPTWAGLHFEICQITSTLDSARAFLLQHGILHSTMPCSSCSQQMVLTPCAASKSPDLQIWKCRPCKKFKNLRTGSILSGSNLSLQIFLVLLSYFSSKTLSNVEIAAYTGLSENSVGVWRCSLSGFVASFLLQNGQPLGGPGIIVEIDEAKFGKRKYHRGNYKERMWILGGA